MSPDYSSMSFNDLVRGFLRAEKQVEATVPIWLEIARRLNRANLAFDAFIVDGNAYTLDHKNCGIDEIDAHFYSGDEIDACYRSVIAEMEEVTR